MPISKAECSRQKPQLQGIACQSAISLESKNIAAALHKSVMAVRIKKRELLVDWYCRYTRTNMPYAYSSTWDLALRSQCKVAINTLQDMQKGVKLHNAFIQWRYAGDEVWCGVLYFIIALLDKWPALISGGIIVSLSTTNDITYRMTVGFVLAYYLIGAVVLDSVSQPTWLLAGK